MRVGEDPGVKSPFGGRIDRQRPRLRIFFIILGATNSYLTRLPYIESYERVNKSGGYVKLKWDPPRDRFYSCIFISSFDASIAHISGMMLFTSPMHLPSLFFFFFFFLSISIKKDRCVCVLFVSNFITR